MTILDRKILVSSSFSWKKALIANNYCCWHIYYLIYSRFSSKIPFKKRKTFVFQKNETACGGIILPRSISSIVATIWHNIFLLFGWNIENGILCGSDHSIEARFSLNSNAFQKMISSLMLPLILYGHNWENADAKPILVCNQ